MSAPRVSIGIPTFQRPELLHRAVASALGQTHADLEVVIADNASHDRTPEVCAAWAARDDRVRVIRRAENIGPTANFNALWRELRGELVLLLSDDDHLEPGYVAACLQQLDADPALVVVAGRARVVRDGAPAGDGHLVSLRQPAPADRLRAFFHHPGDGPFYGLVRRAALEAALPMPNVLANDWLHVGRLAAAGQVAMREDVRVVREAGGTSASIAEILRTFGAGGRGARVPHLVMAWQVLADVGWRSPAHAAAVPDRRQRLLLAARCAPGVIDWPSLAWHLTAPTFLGLQRRPRGRPVARAYDRLTRALGAGQGG